MPGGQTHQPIFTQNGSNDMNSRKDVPFAVKIEKNLTPSPPRPKRSKFGNFFDKIFARFRI